MMFRIGFGYDVHPLTPNRHLILGGIHIPNEKGVMGHSDGDALIHAICDALLGALALRDIGHHFPDTSQEYKDIDSSILLHKTVQLIRDRGYDIGNIDSTICLERPRINQYIPGMQKHMAEVLAIQPDQISIKATTNEKMGFVGREEGVAVYAITLLKSMNQ